MQARALEYFGVFHRFSKLERLLVECFGFLIFCISSISSVSSFFEIVGRCIVEEINSKFFATPVMT